MEKEQGREEKAMKARLWKWAAIFTLILSLYILAIGPTAELVHKRYIPPWAFWIAYWPIAKVDHYMPSLESVINPYIEWWVSPED